MNQSTIRKAWIAFIFVSNAVFLGYLQYYQNPGGLVFGLPETWVVLFGIMLGVFATNSVIAWYYLDKPNVRQVFGGGAGPGGEV